jgi:hypothetical protein
MRHAVVASIALLSGAGLGVAPLACSSSSTPPPIGNQPKTMPTTTATTTTRPPTDAGDAARVDDAMRTDDVRPDSQLAAESSAPVDAASLCGEASANGPILFETVAGGPAPAAMGGFIEPGSYQLVGLMDYTGGDAAPGYTGLVARRELVMGIATYSYANGTGTAPDDAETPPTVTFQPLSGGTYASSGTSLVLSQVCPTAGTTVYSYTSQGTALTLYQGGHVEYFQIVQ